MKIAIHSPAFPPHIGGLEEMARICAQELHSLGEQVTVICDSPNDPPTHFDYPVLRNPSWRECVKVTRECDVFLMFNMSLKRLHFPMLFRKPLVISHQGWYGISPEDLNRHARFKRRLSRILATNIACSQAVADYLGGTVHVIPNAYNENLFHERSEIARSRDILFVGRLVSDKGADLLLNSIAQLRAAGINTNVTITGSGPEESPLRQQVAELNLGNHVEFSGVLRGEALARKMNAHRILVVPSIWAEPFGIVALEGIASGCHVIGSERGGLKDAVGDCGTTFPNGDVNALTRSIQKALQQPMPGQEPGSREIIRRHLERHQAKNIGRAFQAALQKLV